MRLCKEVYDSPTARHKGYMRTCALFSRSYYLPGFWKFIQRYIRNCHVCRRAKARYHPKHRLLRPLLVPQRRWDHVTMDFITSLPIVDKYDAMLVVMDRLTKMGHIINCRSDCTTEELANLYLPVWKAHGFHLTVTSDRRPQFVAQFWKALNSRLGTNVQLSTAYHPETDGQTERTNSTVEQYLRAFVNYLQDDWPRWTPLCEFTFNNSESETTGVTPFFANSGQHPRAGFEPVDNSEITQETLKAHELADQMEELTEYLKESIELAQAKHEYYANAHRMPSPKLKVGDQVWLDARNIKTQRPSKKLD